MKIFVFCLPVIAAFAVVGLRLAQPQRPVEVYAGNTFDIGVVAPGTAITHRFLLHNPAVVAATVETPPADCGCDAAAVAVPEANAIAPQGTAGVTVKAWARGAGQRIESVKVVVRQGSTPHDLWLFVQYTTKTTPKEARR